MARFYTRFGRNPFRRRYAGYRMFTSTRPRRSRLYRRFYTRSNRLRRGSYRRLLYPTSLQRPELKYVNYSRIGASVTIAPTDDVITMIPQGTLPNQRIGSKVIAKYMTYEIQIRPLKLADQEAVRIVVWYCKAPQGVTQYIANYLQSLDDSSVFNMDKKNDIIVLLDKHVQFAVDSNKTVHPLDPCTYKGKLTLNLPLTYNGVNGSPGDSREGQIIVSCWSHRNAVPGEFNDCAELYYHTTVRYTDV